jgi:hypothetical protein
MEIFHCFAVHKFINAIYILFGKREFIRKLETIFS